MDFKNVPIPSPRTKKFLSTQQNSSFNNTNNVADVGERPVPLPRTHFYKSQQASGLGEIWCLENEQTKDEILDKRIECLEETDQCNALFMKLGNKNSENIFNVKDETKEKKVETLILESGYKDTHREKNIIKEIISTEITYVQNLHRIVYAYKMHLLNCAPEPLKRNIPHIFGNITAIHEAAQKCLFLLQENEEQIDGIITTFVDSLEDFNLHVEYSKNKLNSDNYLEQVHAIIKEREKELCDQTGLVAHLSSPLLRLSKYVVLLENIKKKLVLSKKSLVNLEIAKTGIENVLKKCNDSIAINSIKNCGLDLSKQGSFIMRAAFNILIPRKFPSMVFLFDNIVVFTERTKNLNEFQYVDSIQMNHLNIRYNEEKSLAFFLVDFCRLRKFNDSFATYLLEADKEKVKKDWVNTIETKLWKQLNKAKENRKYSKDILTEDISSSSTGTLRRQNKDTGNAIFYVDDINDDVFFV